MPQATPEPEQIEAVVAQLRHLHAEIHGHLAEIETLAAARAGCIRQLQDAGWSLQQIANEVGVSKPRVWRMLQGKS